VQADGRLCDDFSVLLAESVEDPTALAPAASRHLESCLRCQAELAQHRKILRTMRSMRLEVIEPNEHLLGDVLDLLRPPATVHKLHRADRRKAYISGIAAAATAGAAGAIVLASRVAIGRRLAS